VFNAPLQNVGFLILQRWVFNFGTLGFLFVFFIRHQLYNLNINFYSRIKHTKILGVTTDGGGR